MDNMHIFSDNEEKVLKVLNRHRRVLSINELTKKIYGTGYKHTALSDANNSVAAVVRRINMKCKHHKLDWFINGYGTGRAGRYVWKDKKK